MYIRALKINNFRGLNELWFLPNKDVNVVVGPNNSGKTTILTAMKLLFDPAIRLQRDETISRFDFHNGDTTNPVVIRAWLSLDDETNTDIILRFGDKVSCWQVKNEILKSVEVEPGDDLPDGTEELLAIKLISQWNKEIEVAETELLIVDELDNKKGVFTYQDREVLNFRYYGTHRNPAYELSLARQSLLSKTLRDQEVTRKFRDLMKLLESNKSDLLELESIKDTMKNLETLISPELIGGFDSFTLTFLDANIGRFKGVTSVGLHKEQNGNDKVIPVSMLGDGSQNLLLLMQIVQALKQEDASLIVAIEEPEQNLEPSLAKWVFNQITSTPGIVIKSNFGDNQDEAGKKKKKRMGQLFVTTHSPALIGELQGADSICRLSRPHTDSTEVTHVKVASRLEPIFRKSLEQYRDQYAPALLAQNALVVEGPSEEGLLPILFNHLGTIPACNPFFLGLAIVNADGATNVWKHSRNLKALGVSTHALLDYDVPAKELKDSEAQTKLSLYELTQKYSDFVTCYPQKSPLDFCKGYDTEVMLVNCVDPEILLEGIRKCYEDAGHELNNDKWTECIKKEINQSFQAQIPSEFPKNFSTFTLDSIKCSNGSVNDSDLQRAFLYAALHEPHGCKSQKDMRIIGETLVENDCIPKPLKCLHKRIIKTLTREVEPGGGIHELGDDC